MHIQRILDYRSIKVHYENASISHINLHIFTEQNSLLDPYRQQLSIVLTLDFSSKTI